MESKQLTTTTLIRLLHPCMFAAFWPELYLTELPLHCLPCLSLPCLHASDCPWTACDAKRISRHALKSSIGVDSTCLWFADINSGPQPETSPRHWDFKLEPDPAQIGSEERDVVQRIMTIGMLCGLLFLRREFRWMRADQTSTMSDRRT